MARRPGAKRLVFSWRSSSTTPTCVTSRATTATRRACCRSGSCLATASRWTPRTPCRPWPIARIVTGQLLPFSGRARLTSAALRARGLARPPRHPSRRRARAHGEARRVRSRRGFDRVALPRAAPPDDGENRVASGARVRFWDADVGGVESPGGRRGRGAPEGAVQPREARMAASSFVSFSICRAAASASFGDERARPRKREGGAVPRAGASRAAASGRAAIAVKSLAKTPVSTSSASAAARTLTSAASFSSCGSKLWMMCSRRRLRIVPP